MRSMVGCDLSASTVLRATEPSRQRATTVTGPSSDKANTGYRHEALLYAGDHGFLDAVVPFVADGVARRSR